MRPPKEKMHAEAPIFNPSFVYRQDGYELSYKIVGVFYYKTANLSRKRRAYCAAMPQYAPLAVGVTGRKSALLHFFSAEMFNLDFK